MPNTLEFGGKWKFTGFAGMEQAGGGRLVRMRRPPSTETGRKSDRMTKGKKKCVTCEECFFKQNMLCALDLGEPCTTFRPAERNLAPERQLSFTFRSERTRSAYAFPQPQRT